MHSSADMQPALEFRGTRRYRMIRPLGMGGMGAVYEVADSLTQARVAMKVMLTQDARRLLRFKQEFRIAGELHHRNLVRLLDLGQEEGRWFFTMELVDGCDLLTLLHGKKEPADHEATMASAPLSALAAWEPPAPLERPPEVTRTPCDLEGFRRALGQVLDALEFLHGQGLVHRDRFQKRMVRLHKGASPRHRRRSHHADSHCPCYRL